MSETSREGARAIFAERNMMSDAHMEASTLAQSSLSQHADEVSVVRMNEQVADKAHEVGGWGVGG